MTPIASLRMWRAWRIIVPVVVGNAAVQVSLILLPVPHNSTFVATIVALISGVVALAGLVIVAMAAHIVGETPVTWARVRISLRQHFWWTLLWVTLVAAAVFLGASFWVVPGVVLVAITPFVLIAAAAGDRHPLKSNFQIIGRKFWRWLVTVMLIGVMVTVGALLAGFTEFFLRELLGASIVWLVLGLFASWVITGFTLIYRKSVDVTHSAAQ